MATIFNIPIEKLHPHKRNPRIDLGDLSELAASIKANGVMQNLTVIDDGDGDSYTVVIGHRRLAAAKVAGLTELPCSISHMDEQEQIRTMLIENMQRSDLTVYEQAQGFQMMLDFGDTVDTIAEHTGFSAATVRRRVKLLELDQKKFKKAESRGATLMDFAELERINDPVLKDAVLDVVGTSNFREKLKAAIESESLKKRMADWEAAVSEFAEKIDQQGYIGEEHVAMDYVRNFGQWTNKSDTVERPANADTVRYFYRITDRDISVYREHKEAEKTEEQIRAEETRVRAQKRYDELNATLDRHFGLRTDFVRDFKESKKHIKEIGLLAVAAIPGRGGYYQTLGLNADVLEQTLGIRVDVDDHRNDGAADAKLYDLLFQKTQANMEHTLFSVAFGKVEGAGLSYAARRWNSEIQAYQNVHVPNKMLDLVYEVLCSLGYEMSDEECAMKDGTHDLLDKVED